LRRKACPTGLKALYGTKKQFPELSNRARALSFRSLNVQNFVLAREIVLLARGARAHAPERATNATPPLRPPFRAWSGAVLSPISPVAIRMTWTALPIASAGRFSPLGPLGMKKLLVCGDQTIGLGEVLP